MNGFLGGLITGPILTATLVIALVVARGWRHAVFSDVSVGWPAIIGMRLRGTPPALIIDAFVALRKRDREVPLTMVEVAYLAHRRAGLQPVELAALVERDFGASAG
jgi:uncharacterized protein YqfA (UPF0365 family)